MRSSRSALPYCFVTTSTKLEPIVISSNANRHTLPLCAMSGSAAQSETRASGSA